MDVAGIFEWQFEWKSLVAGVFLMLILLKIFGLTPGMKSRKNVNLPPGPFSYPIVANFPALVGGPPHKLMANLSWKNNWPIVRLNISGHNTFIISTPEYANEVLKRSSLAFGSREPNIKNFAKRIFASSSKGGPKGLAGNPLSDNFFVTRRVMTKAINQFKRNFGDRFIVQELDTLFDKIDRSGRADGVCIHNFNAYINEFLVNHNLKFIYGQRDEKLSMEIWRLNDTAIKCLRKAQLCVYFPFLKIFFYKKYFNLMRQTMRRKYEVIEELLAARERLRAGEGEPWYFCDTVVEAEKNGEIDHEDLQHILDETILAGSDTTGNTISWGLAHLVSEPEVVRRVQQEMDSTLGKGVPLRADDIDKLPFFKATIKEIFRLHPSVPLLVPHSNPEAVKLHNFDIPKNSTISVNVWMLARDPKYWEKPNEFLPDRFMRLQDMDVLGTDNRLLPFGAGKRMCPGISVALPSVQLFIGRLVQRYDLVLPGGMSTLSMTEKLGGSVRIRQGKCFCLRKRA